MCEFWDAGRAINAHQRFLEYSVFSGLNSFPASFKFKALKTSCCLLCRSKQTFPTLLLAPCLQINNTFNLLVFKLTRKSVFIFLRNSVFAAYRPNIRAKEIHEWTSALI